MTERNDSKAKSIGCSLVLGLVLAVGLIGVFSEEDASPPGGIEFVEMPGLANFAMIIPAGMAADKLVDLAKDKCGTNEICSVFAWKSRNDVARTMPMTDREYRAMQFQYSVNRNTGFEERLWNCKTYPAKKGDDCLSSDI